MMNNYQDYLYGLDIIYFFNLFHTAYYIKPQMYPFFIYSSSIFLIIFESLLELALYSIELRKVRKEYSEINKQYFVMVLSGANFIFPVFHEK
jgi:hypothetical protein